MNGSLSRNYVCLSFYLKNDHTSKLSSVVQSYACALVISRDLHSPTKKCSLMQIMKQFIQIHILVDLHKTQAGLLRVKELDY